MKSVTQIQLKSIPGFFPIPLSSIFLIAILTGFLLSCTPENDQNLPFDSNEKNEMKLAEEGYLIFDTWDSFIKYSNLPPSRLPDNFTSLNNVIRDLKAVYENTGAISDLKNFYKLENGNMMPHYPFMAFTSLLDENKVVQVDNKLIKMDFDEVKESVNLNYNELVDDINVKVVPSYSSYSFEKNFTRRFTTCIGYLQITQLYNLAIGSYVADDMGHPDPVVGTFRANGGSLHYTGSSSPYGSFLKSFNSTSNPHGYVAATLELPCEDVYVTFSPYSGRIEFTSVGVNVNCDYDGIPTSTGGLMNACD